MTPNDVKIVADSIDDFIEVPDGVTRLRKAVLTLAVSGKLVPQDKKEGTAEELYKEIQEYQKKKIEGRKKKILDSAPLDEEEAPFEIPKTWKWVRFTEIASIFNGNSINKNEKEIKYKDVEGIPYIATKDVGFDHVINYESGIGIPKDEWNNFKLAPKNSVFVCAEGGSAGRKVAHLEREVFFGNKLFAIHPPSILDSKYVFYYCTSSEFFSAFQSVMAGLIGGVSINKFGDLLLPLPPAGEQVRIVKKVEEVMKQLDELEIKKRERDGVRARLTRSAMHSLGRGESEIAFEQLAELIKTPSDLKELEESLITLAVTGRISTPITKDSPATDLLDTLASERELKGRTYSGKSITDSDLPPLPVGWAWSPLAALFSVITDGDHQPPPKADSGIPFLVIGNLNKGIVDFDNCRYVTHDYFNSLDEIRKPQTRDILYTVTGSWGISIPVITDRPFCVQRHVAILKALPSSPVEYVNIFLKSSMALKYGASIATGIAQKTVPLKGLREMPVALPPLSEQKRIIKKIEEVMDLINRLKKVMEM